MNFFFLAIAILSALFALRSVLRILRVTLGNRRWSSSWGFGVNAIIAATTGPLALWLFQMAVSA